MISSRTIHVCNWLAYYWPCTQALTSIISWLIFCSFSAILLLVTHGSTGKPPFIHPSFSFSQYLALLLSVSLSINLPTLHWLSPLTVHEELRSACNNTIYCILQNTVWGQAWCAPTLYEPEMLQKTKHFEGQKILDSNHSVHLWELRNVSCTLDNQTPVLYIQRYTTSMICARDRRKQAALTALSLLCRAHFRLDQLMMMNFQSLQHWFIKHVCTPCMQCMQKWPLPPFVHMLIE